MGVMVVRERGGRYVLAWACWLSERRVGGIRVGALVVREGGGGVSHAVQFFGTHQQLLEGIGEMSMKGEVRDLEFNDVGEEELEDSDDEEEEQEAAPKGTAVYRD